jgi:hypothetical protein
MRLRTLVLGVVLGLLVYTVLVLIALALTAALVS